MNRVFITFTSGEQYEKLSDLLRQGIDRFSKYKLIIYKPEDFDIEWKPENWEPAYVYIYKVLSCLKALEKYDEIVWLDNDCLPTYNIDKIWSNKVDYYPLLPNERFNNFIIWPNEKSNYQDTNFLKEAKNRIGVTDIDFSNSYLQACCMLFNKNCLDFFKEVLHHYQDFNNDVYPSGDESIINCMIWRDKLPNNLGDIFLCSYYFSPYTIEDALKSSSEEEYFNVFDINHRKEGINEDSVFLKHGWSLARHNRIGLVKNNFYNLLFLHGSKKVDLHEKYLTLTK